MDVIKLHVLQSSTMSSDAHMSEIMNSASATTWTLCCNQRVSGARAYVWVRVGFIRYAVSIHSFCHILAKHLPFPTRAFHLLLRVALNRPQVHQALRLHGVINKFCATSARVYNNFLENTVHS